MKPRSFAPVSDSLERSLYSYALSATAAGVAALALAQPAEGRIVYKPLHIFVPFGPPYEACVSVDNEAASVCLAVSGELSLISLLGGVRPYAAPNSPIGRNISGYSSVLALRSGAKIGPAQAFGGYLMAKGHGTSYIYWRGFWANEGKGVKNRYFGFRFKGKDAKLHYGWARITVKMSKPNNVLESVLVSGLAFETTPNKPIIAGKTSGPDVITPPAETETGTLGRLALGRR